MALPAEIPTSPSAALLGWQLVEQDAAKGWVKIAFEAKREFLNPSGFVQGGFLAAMLDDSMGPALWIMTKGAFYPATIAMTVCFLEPAAPGPLFGEGQVFLEGRLSGNAGRLIARATANARMVPAKQAVG